MKVIKMIGRADAERLRSKSPPPQLGGFFEEGMRWDDYIERFNEEKVERAEALREYILEHDVRLSGYEHQNSDEGTPMLDDGTIAWFSFRAWGDLMAAVWSSEDHKNYSYMDFYC